MRIRRNLARTVCSSALLACVVGSVGAADFAYEATLGLGHSDNIGRTESNEQEEDIASAGLRFSLDRQSSRLQANAVGNVAYAEYLDNTYDSEVLGNFAGNARVALVPQRFEWVISDNFGQTLADPFSPTTPDNRENINYFSTGPEVTLAFGSRMRLRLGGRYSLATYEDSPLDFDTKSGDAALIRTLSAASNLSLNVRAAQTTYDERALNADYDQREAFVRYDVAGARTRISLDAGYTEVDRDAAADSEDGLLLRLDATRRLSPSSTAVLTAGREFSNSGSAFAGLQGVGGVGLEAVGGQQTAQPFVNDYITLGWNFSRQRTSFGVYGAWSDQSYDATPALDQTLTSLGGQFRRELSPQTSLGLHAVYSRGEFQLPNSDYDDMNAGLTFGWRLSRSVSLNATYDHFKRSSDRPDGDSAENRYWLTLAYGRGTPRSSLAGMQYAPDAGL